MACRITCTKHPHNPDALVRHIVSRCEDGEGGQARAISVQCSFGEPGSGKSEWNLFIGNLVQKELTGQYIDPKSLKHQLRFEPKNFPTMAQDTPKRHSVFCDEGSGEGANRLQPMKTENVQVAIDLDACRSRGQPVFWANPNLDSLAKGVSNHATWMFNHGRWWVQAYEIQVPHAIYGKNQFKHDRFTLLEKPSLQEEFPELRAAYLELKAYRERGQDINQLAQSESLVALYRQRLEALRPRLSWAD